MSALFLGLAGAIAAAAIGLIALPLLKKDRRAAADDSAADALHVRLAAIARDRDSDLINADAAADAEIEAKRAAIADSATPAAALAPARVWRLAAIAFLAAAPLGVAGLYLSVGAPALIDPPPALAPRDIAALPEDQRRAMIENMVAELAARLEAQPEDADGWRMLARSQMVLERPEDAAASYRRLLAAAEGDLDDWRNFANALAASSPEQQFPSGQEFMRALSEIEKRAPGDMMALFYRGGAARQSGDAAGAASIWRQLLAGMPADAPVRGTLEELIAEADAAALNKPVPK